MTREEIFIDLGFAMGTIKVLEALASPLSEEQKIATKKAILGLENIFNELNRLNKRET